MITEMFILTTFN